MRKFISFKQFQFYILVGLALLVEQLIVDFVSHPETFLSWSLNEIWRIVYIVFINYFFFEYILEELSKKRILRSIYLLVIQLFLSSVGLYVWRSIGIGLHVYTSFKAYPSISDGIFDQFGSGVVSILFFGIIKFLFDFKKMKETEQKLRIEKQESELNYLKSQTNPHFLFNTLNNIYSLARDKSDLTPDSVLRLSKILRFMLYETGGAFIGIEQELKIINDYIALEKLRYDDSLNVSFKYEIEDMKQPIPPLLLIPLVENAFKHGVSETRNKPFLDIHLTANQQQLEFVVINSAEKLSREGSVKENIGLSNLRRQLALLYKDYNLSIQQSESVFSVKLNINLASHV